MEPIEQAPCPDSLNGKTVATMLKGETAILITADGDRNKLMVLPGGDLPPGAIPRPGNGSFLDLRFRRRRGDHAERGGTAVRAGS